MQKCDSGDGNEPVGRVWFSLVSGGGDRRPDSKRGLDEDIVQPKMLSSINLQEEKKKKLCLFSEVLLSGDEATRRDQGLPVVALRLGFLAVRAGGGGGLLTHCVSYYVN